MKNPPTVKTGDRVRIVLEGDVNDSFGNPDSSSPLTGPGVALGRNGQGSNTIWTKAPHVVSVEILKQPVKVGDRLSGYDNPEPPLGTVLQFDGADPVELAVRWPNGWYHVGAGPYEWKSIDHGDRTVISVAA